MPGTPSKQAGWAIYTVAALAVVAAAVIAFRLLPESGGKVQPTQQFQPAVREKPPASLPLLEPAKALQQLAAPEGGEWRVVSQFPRIYVQDGFLSEPECEILKQQVAGRLEPAKVVQKADNKFDEQVSVRNNRQIWLNYTQERDDPDVFHLLKRMHRASRIPDDDAEALQIGHYGVGEKYETHQDSDPGNDVARPATLIVYLNDVEDGGETLFPLGNRQDCTMQWRAAADGSSVFGASACCDRSDLLRVSPKKGRAVLFFNHDAAGRKDRMAEHAACPVKQGEKWIAQRWFRYEPYQRLVHPLDLRRHLSSPSHMGPRLEEPEWVSGLKHMLQEPEWVSGLKHMLQVASDSAEEGRKMLYNLSAKRPHFDLIPDVKTSTDILREHVEQIRSKVMDGMTMITTTARESERSQMANIQTAVGDVGKGQATLSGDFKQMGPLIQESARLLKGTHGLEPIFRT
eukprot:s1171_g6.t1